MEALPENLNQTIYKKLASTRLNNRLMFWACLRRKYRISNQIQVSINIIGIRYRTSTTYIHSQINLHMCAKFFTNRSSRLTASPDCGICDPLTPSPPRNARWGIDGRLVFSLCPFPDESADVNQSWCQSVQPFDSFCILLTP